MGELTAMADLTEVSQGLENIGEVFASKEVVQGSRRLVAQFVLLSDAGGDFA